MITQCYAYFNKITYSTALSLFQKILATTDQPIHNFFSFNNDYAVLLLVSNYKIFWEDW